METPDEEIPLYIPPEFADTLQATILYGRGYEDSLAGREMRDLGDLSEAAADAYRRGYKEGQARRSPPGKKYKYGPR